MAVNVNLSRQSEDVQSPCMTTLPAEAIRFDWSLALMPTTEFDINLLVPGRSPSMTSSAPWTCSLLMCTGCQ